MARQKWPPRLIHAVSPRSRHTLLVVRAALRDEQMRQQNPQAPTPPRHPATPLGPKLFQRVPVSVSPRGCPMPLSPDLQKIHVSQRWATNRMYPAYVDARQTSADPMQVVDAIYRAELPDALSAPATPAGIELARRIQLAVVILMRSEGIDAVMPYQPAHPRPNPMPPVQEGWIRGILTGWP